MGSADPVQGVVDFSTQEGHTQLSREDPQDTGLQAQRPLMTSFPGSSPQASSLPVSCAASVSGKDRLCFLCLLSKQRDVGRIDTGRLVF
jgi:hypothetical protein